MTICIHKDVLFWEDLFLRVPHRQVFVSNTTIGPFEDFVNGKCNVMATENARATAGILDFMGYQGQVAVGTQEYTSDMWGLVSIDSDPEWADFLNTLLIVLMEAEDAGITKDNVHDRIGQTNLFGEQYKDMFVNAIRTNGNFGSVYEYPVPRDGRNIRNNGTSGCLASPPLGDVELDDHSKYHGESPPGPREGGIMERVLKQGELRCGVHGGRPGFAEFNSNASQWTGIDVDYCTALASSLYNGETQMMVSFYDIATRSDANGFVALQENEIDVFAGALWTLENDVREEATNVGFSFSQPYFYGPQDDERFEDNLCLATRNDDPQWSSYFYWVAQSLVYAEEKNIDQRSSNEMPLVKVFGFDQQRAFRDAILSVGNYGEVYARHLESILPRSGRNGLNLNEPGRAPLRYMPPSRILDIPVSD